jgi:O-antigen/teichoic acid export membrane protein
MLSTLSKARVSSLYNNAFYLMLNSVIASLLGFVFWNIMARVFSAAEVGIGSALVSASGLVAALANLGLGVGVVRFIPEFKNREIHLINGSFTIVTVIALFGSIVYIVAVESLSPALSFIQQNYIFALLFVLFTIFTVLSTLTDQSLIAARSANRIFYKNTIISLIKIPLPVYAFSVLAGMGIFVGTGVGIVAGVLISWFLFLTSVYPGYHLFPTFQKDLMSKLLPYSFANYLANLLNGAPAFIYPLMVLNVLGAEQNAYFYITWMMVMVLSIIPSGMAQSLFAEGSHDQARLAHNGRRALGISLLLSLPAIAAMILLGGWFLHFFGPSYAEYGTGVMRYLALAVLPQCVNVLFITVNQVQKRVHLIITQTGALSVLSLGLGYLLLVKYGLNGLGMAYVLAQFLVAAVVIGPLLRRLKDNKPAEVN